MSKKITPPKEEAPKEDEHPFRVGQQYRNRDGEYHVVSISEPNMVIRYLNGRVIESSILLQARIWENIQESSDNDFELEAL